MDYQFFMSYRGLQKPLEFMGLKGRYVYIGAGIVIGAVISFILAYLISGFIVASILIVLILLIGTAWIFIKQKKGLHSKPTREGIYIVTHLISIGK